MTDQTSTELSAAGVPQDAVARLAELKPGSPGAIFTSDLSVNEFLLVREAGFRPLGLVLGSSIYHVGLQIADHLFRREAGRMVSSLVRVLGVSHLTLAEDAVQDALVRALETWKFGRMPENPAAWLMRAARNRAIDLLRQLRDPKAKDVFLTEFAKGKADGLRVALLGGLEGFDDPAVGETVLGGYAGYTPTVKKRAVQLLLSRPACTR